MRKASVLSAFLCGLSLLFLAATPASADPNAPGNNGTIKIHESPGEREPAMANDPHVCLFHVHGFKFDNNSTGEAWIESWPPTGNRSQVWHGTWSAGNSGEWRTADIRLADGHYKAYAKQMNEPTPGGDKQKVFWVECDQTSGGGGSTGSTGSTGATGTSGGNANSGGTSGGITSGGTTVTTAGTVSGSASTGIVAGVQSAPQAVLGVQNLPSTSTDTGQTPLVVLGLVILATGVVLLRRPGVVPSP